MAFALPYGFARSTGFLVVALVALQLAAQTAADPAASFQDRVQPIVFKNCNGCHTFGGHAGELRMDSFATLMKGGGRGPVVVPGHPESSLLLKAVQYDNPDLKMPPRGKLAATDIAVIDHCDLPSIERQLVGGAQSGNTGANYHDVSVQCPGQPRPAEVTTVPVRQPQ